MSNSLQQVVERVNVNLCQILGAVTSCSGRPTPSGPAMHGVPFRVCPFHVTCIADALPRASDALRYIFDTWREHELSYLLETYFTRT